VTRVGAASSSILVVRACWPASTRDLCDASPSGIRGNAFLLQSSSDGSPCDKCRSSLGGRGDRMRRHWNKHQSYQLTEEITMCASYLLDRNHSLAVSRCTVMNSPGIQVRGIRETGTVAE
jgi:hypothetical protein